MCSDGKTHWRHLANTIESSICHGDTVLCQITFTTCYICYVEITVTLRRGLLIDSTSLFIMAILHSRCGHYIFALWFLSFFFFSSPNLSGHRLDVYHTSTHGVALVRI